MYLIFYSGFIVEMLCEYCSIIDWGQLKLGLQLPHHISCVELVKSAERGCKLCGRIWDERMPFSYHPTPQEYDVRQNSQLRLLVIRGQTPRGFDILSIFSGSNEFRSHLGIYADEGISCPLPILTFLTNKVSFAAQRNIINGRPIDKFGGSDKFFAIAQRWLHECLTHHKESCPIAPAAILPTRVIDVGMGGDLAFVHTTRRQKGIWVALSHCWGPKALCTLTSTRLIGKDHPLVLHNLPAAFQDAIIVTRRLGYRYLWIDSLCIIQDVESDWIAESSRMKDYYKDAVFTIAADLSACDGEGFLHYPRPTHSQDIEVPFWEGNAREGSVFIRGCVDDPWKQRYRRPLDQRAWTLQESMLSCRVLHFDKQEQFWDCQQHFRFESSAASKTPDWLEGGLGLKHFFLKPELAKLKYKNDKEMLFKLEPKTRWLHIVSEYMEREITYESDRLPAISGIAKEIYLQENMIYKAGIWMSDLHRSLLWTAEGSGLKPSSYIAPTWSWASLGRLNVFRITALNADAELLPIDECELISTLIDCEVTPLYNDGYSKLRSGRLDLQGPWIPAARFLGGQEPYLNSYWRGAYKFYGGTREEEVPEYDGQIICDFDILPPDADLSRSAFDGISFLQILSNKAVHGSGKIELIYVLMLALTEQDGVFQRVGRAVIPSMHVPIDNLWGTRPIRII